MFESERNAFNKEIQKATRGMTQIEPRIYYTDLVNEFKLHWGVLTVHNSGYVLERFPTYDLALQHKNKKKSDKFDMGVGKNSKMNLKV